MPGKYGSNSIAVTYDDAGGTPRTVTPYILSIGGIKIEAITEQSNPFGSSAEAHTPTGMTRTPDIPIEGHFDTTATSGPHVVFGAPDSSPQAATRTLTFTPGDGKTFTMESRLVDYEVLGQNGNLTKYKATIRQAGLGAWT